MQTQAQRQQVAITPEQSFAVVKTLLSASFGCIAYLRNLLPDENFGEGRLTAGERGMSYASSQEETPGKNHRHISGVAIKTVTRGFSTEADKLLNYLEYGIFHAIERHYLKRFIFAIYLDNDDPNNIVEAYTFNLSYVTIPGTDTAVPVMSLDDQLNKMSLNTRSRKEVDPVIMATSKGKAPTLGDVKQSVKTLIKNLIMHTTHLDPLPKRRFATFKLFYLEHTPPEYEPPYFKPGDPEKDRFVFTTHAKSEVPEKFSIGTVVTPHHGVDVHVQSVAKYIPNEDNNESQFIGVVPVSKNGNGMTKFSGSGSSSSRARQVEQQLKDAEQRVVAWNAEDSRWTDEDAEGEVDYDYVNDSGIALSEPLGIRKDDGSIVPIEDQEENGMETDQVDAQFFGEPELAPSRVGKLRDRMKVQNPAALEPTQPLESTPVILPDEKSAEEGGLAGSVNYNDFMLNGASISHTIDTQALKVMVEQNSNMEWSADSEMLDLETQVETAQTQMRGHDHVDHSTHGKDVNPPTQRPHRRAATMSSVENTEDSACPCEAEEGGDFVQCDGPCQKWFHLWCMGYYSVNDLRIPSSFVCIPCRLKGDIKFKLIEDHYPDILAALMDLAKFRRALKLVEKHHPENLKEFRKHLGCQASLADQLWRRLEREGFISLEVLEIDKVGMVVTRTKATKSGATKKVKGVRQEFRHVFNKASKATIAYKDYFSPDSDAEKKLLGLKDIGRKAKNNRAIETHPHVSDSVAGLRTGAGKNLQTVTSENRAQRGIGGAIPEAIRDKVTDTETQTQEDTQFVRATMAATQTGAASARMSCAPEGDSGASELKRRSNGLQEGNARTGKKVKISVGDGVDIEE